MRFEKPAALTGVALLAAALATGAFAQPARMQPAPLDIETPEFRAVLGSEGAGLTHFILKDERYTRDGKAIDVVSTDKPDFRPLRQRFAGIEGDSPESWKGERVQGGVRLRAELGDLALSRKLQPGQGPYQLWSTLRVRNTGDASQKVQLVEEGHHYVVRELEESGGFIGGRSPYMSGATCVGPDGSERDDREEIVEGTQEAEPFHVAGPVSVGAVGNVYFTQALAAHDDSYESCRVTGSNRGGTLDSPHGSLLDIHLTRKAVTLKPGETHVFKTLYYLGPKVPDLLAQAGHTMSEVNHVAGVPGINTIAHGLQTLLTFIYEKVGNWGLAIILLTFVVKLVLFPLTAKSFESMAAMRRLKPEIDALNEKFANDREKKGAAMMELYKKHRINPLGGCLPQLFQLPIWWALYMSLSTNVELFRQPFVGFWQDLTAPDPYYVLPLGLGLLMYLQQKLTPTTMDAAQAKMMMYMMPGMITVFMLFLPSGLCLYMFTNSVLTIGQQRMIEYRLNNKDGGSSSADDSPAPADSPASSTKQRRRRGRA